MKSRCDTVQKNANYLEKQKLTSLINNNQDNYCSHFPASNLKFRAFRICNMCFLCSQNVG